MRQIVLDTETTGLEVRAGNRILEIGCVEILNRQLTGNNLHFYINPERESEEGALNVHGITTDFLKDKPKFAQIAEEFRNYVKDAEIIIHNAAFDIAFLDEEFRLVGYPKFEEHVSGVIDSLKMARELHPGRRNSLDALCERYEISNAHRVLHGALLDSELLAEVYLAMTRGQNTFSMGLEDNTSDTGETLELAPLEEVVVRYATEAELAEHAEVLKAVDKASKGNCVWNKLNALPESAETEAAAI
jgi:DNA polymerase-3 subunit epsilon